MRQRALYRLRKHWRYDIPNAFEAGFAKVAYDIGLNEAEFKVFYAKCIQRLNKQRQRPLRKIIVKKNTKPARKTSVSKKPAVKEKKAPKTAKRK